MMFDTKTYDLRQWTITDPQAKETSDHHHECADRREFRREGFSTCPMKRYASRARPRTADAVPPRLTLAADWPKEGLSFSPRSPPHGSVFHYLEHHNSVRLRMPIVERSILTLRFQPDVLCLQEIKSARRRCFPMNAFRALGYRAYRGAWAEGLSWGGGGLPRLPISPRATGFDYCSASAMQGIMSVYV